MPEIIACPEILFSIDESGQEIETTCLLPAEVLGQTVLKSTEEPIVHNRIRCLAGHAFLYADLELIGSDAKVIQQMENSLQNTK